MVFKGLFDLFCRKVGKYGRSMTKGRVSTKHTTRGLYKGVGCRRLGRHTRKGRYIVNPLRIPEYVVPDLTGFELKPYVSKNTPKIKVLPITVNDVPDLKFK
eukprot:TRINITY_DN1835_c0_g1_i1.p1 TRINITY_DN1835_c0_g1~~TRINITY_DN1835_c0_g1_i1.p1  ORF type:complete len:101 (+),score=13.30 TRINITY_DN1835_c0_g1_i1:5-307(+)